VVVLLLLLLLLLLLVVVVVAVVVVGVVVVVVLLLLPQAAKCGADEVDNNISGSPRRQREGRPTSHFCSSAVPLALRQPSGTWPTLCMYGWIPHNASFWFLDIAGPTLGVVASSDRV
jgi:hypothetical protein